MEDGLGTSWQSDRLPDDASRDELLGVTILDRLAGDSLTVGLFKAWPFNLSSARDSERTVVSARLAESFQALAPGERELFADRSLDAMHQHLWLAMGDAWLASGHASQGLAAYRRHIHRRPWEAAGYLGAARALRARGKLNEADAMQNRTRDVAPGVELLPTDQST